MALRKEMQEMQEWINQAEEDYLERDFTYKTPEELRKAVEELKVCLPLTQGFGGSDNVWKSETEYTEWGCASGSVPQSDS